MAIGLSKLELKNILIGCIGEKKGLSKEDILGKLIKGFDKLSEMEKFYWNVNFHNKINNLRKDTDFFVVMKNNVYFVPTKLSDLSQYKKILDSNRAGMANNWEKAVTFVEEAKWKNL